MGTIKATNFYTVQGWMYDLGLSSAQELCAYAIVYGFCQDGQSTFKGSISYIAELLMCTTRTAIKVMHQLETKGLIFIDKEEVSRVVFNRYRVNYEKISWVVKNFHGGSENISVGVVKNFHPINNMIYNNTSSSTARAQEKVDVSPLSAQQCHSDIGSVVASPPAQEKVLSDKERLFSWVTDNEIGLEQTLKQAGLLTHSATLEEMTAIVEPYVEDFYNNLQMSGKEDITTRGRSEVKSHFSSWLRKRTEIDRQQQNSNSNGNSQSNGGWSPTTNTPKEKPYSRILELANAPLAPKFDPSQII